MAVNKVIPGFDEAVADVYDGAVLLIGGFGTVVSCASRLIEAIARRDIKNLTIVGNTAGFGAAIWDMAGFTGFDDHDLLVRTGMVSRAIVSFPVHHLIETNLEKKIKSGEVEFEMVPQGTMAERIRAAKAGIGGFYTPTATDTMLEEGKETRIIDGRKYVLEYPIKADFAIIRAYMADRWGNLVYRGTSRTFNATMAGAARVTIAEVDEVVELGELDPEAIVTPGIYVDRIVARQEEG